jgi:hypothetical protein
MKTAASSTRLAVANVVRNKKVVIAKSFLLSSFAIVTFYFAFWLLTGVFPVYFILVLLITSFLAMGIYEIAGAVGGFTIKQKKEKITFISFIYGAKNYRVFQVISLIILVCLLVSIVGSLWMYWKYPGGSADRKVWVALFHFTFLQLSAVVCQVFFLWPIVTSEFIDDDVRNSYLAEKFSAIISTTLTLLFPFWIFKEELNDVLLKRGIHLPDFWILLSIPLLIFIITALFPFFIGMYKYRSQTRAMLEWRKDWLGGVINDLTLPEGALQQQRIQDKIVQLETKITEEIEDNDLLNFFKGNGNMGITAIKPRWQKTIEKIPVIQKTAEIKSITDIEFEESHTVAGENGHGPRGSVPAISPVPNIVTPSPEDSYSHLYDEQTRLTIEYIRSQNQNLVKWDLRIKNIYTLLDIYSIDQSPDRTHNKQFLEAEALNMQKDEKIFRARKNIFAGALLSAMTALIIWLFKTFEKDIADVIRNLMS